MVSIAKRGKTQLPELPLGTIATLGSAPPCSLLRLGRWTGGGMRRLATFPRLWRPCWRAAPAPACHTCDNGKHRLQPACLYKPGFCC